MKFRILLARINLWRALIRRELWYAGAFLRSLK